MRILIIASVMGATDESGVKSMLYRAGETYDVFPVLAESFVRRGFAERIGEIVPDTKVVTPVETKVVTIPEKKIFTKYKKVVKKTSR